MCIILLQYTSLYTFNYIFFSLLIPKIYKFCDPHRQCDGCYCIYYENAFFIGTSYISNKS